MKKTIVITGTSSGIGKALAQYCVEQGYYLVAVCRKSKKSEASFEELLTCDYKFEPKIIYGDLSSKLDITNIVETISSFTESIDLLINNAGVLMLKERFSSEGIEMTMAVNLLANYRLTEQLLDKYHSFSVINITSELFKKGKLNLNELEKMTKYSGSVRYNDSKLAQVYYTSRLAERLSGSASIIAMHPGVVATNAFRDYPVFVMKLMNLLLQDPNKAARKIMAPFIQDKMENGYYYSQNKMKDQLSDFVDPSKLEEMMTLLVKKYL